MPPANTGGMAVNTRFGLRQIVMIPAMTLALLVIGLNVSIGLAAQSSGSKASAESLPATVLEEPNDLNRTLTSPTGEKPLILHVGFAVLYRQAHIPGSDYAGPASKPEGLDLLRKRLQSVPRSRFIMLYCGCCPWDHCPNIKPAYDEIRKMGFTNVKVMHVADNFGTDWVSKGYPTQKESSSSQ